MRSRQGARTAAPGEGYHTDHSNDVEPPKATALCAVKLPSTGGDTQFVNMYEAYEALPEEMKKRIEGLQARHAIRANTASESCLASRRREEGGWRCRDLG